MEYTVSIINEVFPGFYETDYDPSNIERYDDNNNLEEEFTEEQYKEYTDKFCEYIVSLINQHSPFKVIKWELVSPKYYNYRNDELWVTIDTTPEDILYHCMNSEYSEDILGYIDWDDWNKGGYHEAILQQLVSFPLFEFQDTFLEQLF